MSGITLSTTPSFVTQGQIFCHKGQLQLSYENKSVRGYLIEPSGRVKSVTVEDFPKGLNPENMQAFLNQSYVKLSECGENGAMTARLYTRGLGGGKVEQLKAELDAKGKDKKAVFISYHWDHKDLAKAVEAVLIAEGVMVLRDERALDQPGEDLNAFMQLINHRNLDGVISIVSDQYLKSSNCMVEILETMKRFEWKKSLIPIVVDKQLYSRGSESSYIKHWKDNKRQWQSKQDRDLATAAKMQLEDFIANIRFIIQADVESLQKENFKGIVTRIVGGVANKQAEKTSPNPEEVLPSLIQQKLQKEAVPEIAFGKAKWQKYFGDIGTEPPLPKDIDQILKSPCPFWSGKRVEETHLLVLVPSAVNGKAFTLNTLQELIQNPKTGNKTQYSYYHKHVKNELGNKSESAHWVLMTRDVIPESRNKKYDDQKSLVATHGKKSGIAYELPTALEATTAILMHYVETGKALYTDEELGSQYTYTRCQEKVKYNQWPVTIGGFSFGGLRVSHYDWDDYNTTSSAWGVAGVSR